MRFSAALFAMHNWLADAQESGGIGRRAAIAALLVGGSAAWWKYLDSELSASLLT